MKGCAGLIGTVALSAMVALAAPTLAQGRGGGVGGSANIGAGAAINGMSSSHISSQGSLNTNGPAAADRDFGLDRAQDRANANGNLDSSANSNGLNATDRDHERDRAEDRKNSHGASDSQASVNTSGDAQAGTAAR